MTQISLEHANQHWQGVPHGERHRLRIESATELSHGSCSLYMTAGPDGLKVSGHQIASRAPTRTTNPPSVDAPPAEAKMHGAQGSSLLQSTPAAALTHAPRVLPTRHVGWLPPITVHADSPRPASGPKPINALVTRHLHPTVHAAPATSSTAHNVFGLVEPGCQVLPVAWRWTARSTQAASPGNPVCALELGALAGCDGGAPSPSEMTCSHPC